MPDDDEDRLCGYRDLWQSVLLQAVEDALIGIPARSGMDPARRAAEINAARRYLTKPSEQLDLLCNLAGLNTQAVIDRMKIRIADAPSVAMLIAVKMTRSRNIKTRKADVAKQEVKPRAA